MVITVLPRFLNTRTKEQNTNVTIENVDKVLNLASRNCFRLLIVPGPSEECGDDDKARNIRHNIIN